MALVIPAGTADDIFKERGGEEWARVQGFEFVQLVPPRCVSRGDDVAFVCRFWRKQMDNIFYVNYFSVFFFLLVLLFCLFSCRAETYIL